VSGARSAVKILLVGTVIVGGLIFAGQALRDKMEGGPIPAAPPIPETTQESRERFARQLRYEFLDAREDIKVSVVGVGGRVLSLEFIGFSDVWLHHYRKGDGFPRIRAAGFHTVTLRDGYGWQATVTP
jgi:hypothetical protein